MEVGRVVVVVVVVLSGGGGVNWQPEGAGELTAMVNAIVLVSRSLSQIKVKVR